MALNQLTIFSPQHISQTLEGDIHSVECQEIFSQIASSSQEDICQLKWMGRLFHYIIEMKDEDHALEVLGEILDIDPSWINETNEENQTMPWICVHLGKTKLFKLFMERGYDLNKDDKGGDSGVLGAAYAYKDNNTKKQEEVMDVVLDTEVFSQKYIAKALTAAVQNQNKGGVASLLKHGADLSGWWHADERKTLYVACHALEDKESINILSLLLKHPLLQHHINEDWPEVSGIWHPALSPIYACAYNGNTQMAQMLVDKGARIDSDVEGGIETPTMAASFHMHPHMVEFFLKQRADIHKLDGEGRNALHHVCMASSGDPRWDEACFKTAQVLIDAGIGFDVVDRDGKTPEDYVLNDRPHLSGLLKSLRVKKQLQQETSVQWEQKPQKSNFKM